MYPQDMRHVYWGLKLGTAALCAYEAVAISFDHHRVPTISKVCGNHRWVAPLVLVGLGVHLYWRELGGSPADEW